MIFFHFFFSEAQILPFPFSCSSTWLVEANTNSLNEKGSASSVLLQKYFLHRR